MSYRYDYSYWLNATPITGNPDPDDFIKAMRANELLYPEGSLVTEIHDDGSISAEVRPEDGTVEEDEYIVGNLDKVAAACPEYEITLRATNEEDHSQNAVTTWLNGQNTGTAYGRMIDPGEYDDVSINAALEKVFETLREQGAEHLIPVIQDKLKKEGLLHA